MSQSPPVSPEPSGEPAFLARALAAAMRAHGDQQRKGTGLPYITHPIQVAETLRLWGDVTDPEVLAAAYLHDAVEDTALEDTDIRREFGDRVGDLVKDLTNDESLPRAEKKAQMIERMRGAAPEAMLIKLADRFDNLGDLPAMPWEDERKTQYVQEGKRLLASIQAGREQRLLEAEAWSLPEWLTRALDRFERLLAERINALEKSDAT